jgi:hypothetical protein
VKYNATIPKVFIALYMYFALINAVFVEGLLVSIASVELHDNIVKTFSHDPKRGLPRRTLQQ